MSTAAPALGRSGAGSEQALNKLDDKPVKRSVNTGAKLITPENARD